MFHKILYLGCVLNQINEINLSENINLINLNCHNNLLTQLDISNNNSINILDCHNNSIHCIKVWDTNYANQAELAEDWEKDEQAIWSLDCSGCGDVNACNYDTFSYPQDNSLCIYPVQYYDCNNICINDLDFDLICDEIDDCI